MPSAHKVYVRESLDRLTDVELLTMLKEVRALGIERPIIVDILHKRAVHRSTLGIA